MRLKKTNANKFDLNGDKVKGSKAKREALLFKEKIKEHWYPWKIPTFNKKRSQKKLFKEIPYEKKKCLKKIEETLSY